MIKLIIVRHAEAVERSADVREEVRYLTPEGRSFFRSTAETMKDKGINPDLILTSPLLRAVQTADILAETIAYKGPLIATDDLAPGFEVEELRQLLEIFKEAREIVIVGHEPDLGGIVTSLLSLPEGFTFKKGSAVKLKINPEDPGHPAVFKWLASGGKLTKAI
jgi:phosphohistidine phosphatase